MAESGRNGYKCGICLLPISNPRLLSCHHSFCLSCLEENVKVTNQLRCPTCRTITDIPANGVKGLQRSFYISCEKETVLGQHCDICKSTESRLQKYLECDQLLCEVCAHAHSMMDASRHHRLQTVPANDAREIGKIKSRSFCKYHPKKELEVICKVCDELMCCVCKLTKHKTHVCEDIATEADKKRAETNELIRYYENGLSSQQENALRRARTKPKQKIIYETLSSMKREKEAIIRNIDATFEEFEGKTHGLFEQFNDTSRATEDNLKRVENINKAYVKKCKTVLHSDDDVAILQKCESLVNGLSAIEIVQPPEVSDEEINKNFNICENWLTDLKVQSSKKIDFYWNIKFNRDKPGSVHQSASKVQRSKSPKPHSTKMVREMKSEMKPDKRNKFPAQPSSVFGYNRYTSYPQNGYDSPYRNERYESENTD